MRPPKRVTIRDVAATAGVSHQTVSRVLNDRPDVADETRQRVWQVIDDLRYQPSAIARSLTHQRSLTLGVVTAGLTFVGPSRTLNGIAAQAEEMGYMLLLKELPRFNLEDVRPLLKSLLSHQVDGIIWAVAEVGNNREWLDSEPHGFTVPTVFLTMESRPDLHIVSIDNYSGGRVATEHLLEHGCRHIGHITGPLDWWEARQRMAGWRDALIAAGIEVSDEHWEAGNWSSASGDQGVRRLLERYPTMDGVFVGNDQMALGVLLALCQKGLRSPQDLAIVGFDDVPEAPYYCPPLSTISQDQQLVGRVAVRELVHIIEARQQGQADMEPRTISLEPALIVRESSASARG